MEPTANINLDADANAYPPRLKRTSRGILVAAKSGQVITPETVKEFAEDELGSGHSLPVVA
jgi:hypothetical protein